jgi:hypothetical protein
LPALDASLPKDHFLCCAIDLDAVPPQAREDISMERVRSLLRSTPSRISRRIAQFVAIAAASLPDAGA